MNWNTPYISKKIDEWIDEDIGKGDLTKYAITKDKVKAKWIAKEDGIFCGVEILKLLFKKIDKEIKYNFLITDGEKFSKNQIIKKCSSERSENIEIFLNDRQLSNLISSLKNLNDTKQIIKNKLPFDLLSIELRDSIKNLSKLTGEELNEQLLDNIFSKFCIGK